MNWFRFVFCILLFFGIHGCSTKPIENDPYLGISPKDLFTQGKNAVSSGRYQEAVKLFESFESQYPIDPRAEQVLIEYIYAQYKADEHSMAVAAADRYLRLYPRSKHTDYVLYLKGVINSEQERNLFDKHLPLDLSLRDTTFFREAYEDFSFLIQRFPRSPYAQDAKHRMIFLRNLLAQSELNIAQFYYDREIYVAAINRSVGLIEEFPQSPQVLKALDIIAKSSRALKLEYSYKDALRILRLNFPNSKILKTLHFNP